MNVEIDDPIFEKVVPGKSAYFYTHEFGQDRIREVHRDGSGHLWLSIDGCGVRLEDADFYILGTVPKVAMEADALVQLRALLADARDQYDAAREEATRLRMSRLMAAGHLHQINWAGIPTDEEIEEHVLDAIFALGND